MVPDENELKLDTLGLKLLFANVWIFAESAACGENKK